MTRPTVPVVIYENGHRMTVGVAELETKRDGTLVCVRLDEESELGKRVLGHYPIRPGSFSIGFSDKE